MQGLKFIFDEHEFQHPTHFLASPLQSHFEMKASRTFSRLKLALLHSSANVISSLLGFANVLLAVSLTIDYLGAERFGVWMTVASISSMLTFLDFGVGNGLVSQVAKSRASTDPQKLALTTSRGLFILTGIGIVVGGALFVLNNVFPVASVMKIDSTLARQDAEQLFAVFIVLFSINIPLNGIFKILLGLQLGWIVHITRSASALLSMLLLYILSEREAPPTQLLMATYGVTVFSACAMIPMLYRLGLLTWRANARWSEAKSEYRSLLNIGGLFLTLQIGIMIGWGSDGFIISALNSAATVAQFAIMQRLFQVVSMPLSIMNNPLWGAYADAHARGDTVFIRKTLKLSLLGTIVISIALSASLYLTTDWILDIWIDDHVTVSSQLVLAFAVWKVLQSVGHAFSMALNGMHIVEIQVYSVVLLCVLAIPLKLYLIPRFGATGAMWSTVLAYSLSTVLFYIIIFRKCIVAEFSQHNQADN